MVSQTKSRRAGGAAAFCKNEFSIRLLGKLDVRCLFSASTRVVLDFEGYFVTFVYRSNARALQSRYMQEDVLAAVFRLDEAEATCVIEKLYCAVKAHGSVLSR